MESKAELLDVSRDWKTGKMKLTFLIDSPIDQNTIDSMNGDIRLRAVKWREKRSLTANAYYWVLCGEVARKVGISASRLHNIMLRRYFKPYLIGGKVATIQIPDTEEAEEEVLDAETFHVKPTDNVFKNSKGTTYRSYIILEGSHLMDSKEFSVLLDMMIDEAKGQGIETLPPDEIDRMKAALRDEEKHNQNK